jgi:hypothetical protein
MPRRAWESRPGTAPPTPLARPSPPLCDTVQHGQQQPRGNVPPTPVRPTRHTLEKRRWSPRREGERLRCARVRTTPCRQAGGTGHLRCHRPCATIPAVPQHHPSHCITIPDAVGACGDRTPPRRLLCLVRPHINGTLESSHGRPPNR